MLQTICAKYYYYRDHANRPVVTQCVLYDDFGVKAVGNSVCSPDDNPCKRVGREQALQRAQEALEGDSTQFFIMESALQTIFSIDWARYTRPHHTVFVHSFKA